MPRLLRLQSLPVHEDSQVVNRQTPNLLVKVGIMGVVKAPMRRKLSLSNLFAKSGYKGKVPKARETTQSNTLSVPVDGELGGNSPLSRVRSRSAPFCEMSPIQENYGESVSDSQDSCPSPDNRALLSTLVQSSQSELDTVKRNREGTEDSLCFSESEDPSLMCYVGSSDDSCSSDSERLLNPNFLSSTERERLDIQLSEQSLALPPRSVDISHDLPSNVVLNATTHPPLPELQPIYPNLDRSPRCSATSPVEHHKPAIIGLNHTPGAAHGTTPSRPAPCPRRSSESEINTTPKGGKSISIILSS